MDAFRQPKLSYYMFCSQRPAETNNNLISETGPMVYIANSMTPFSPKDITVYSNCDEVRLTYCKDGKQYSYVKEKSSEGMPSPIITFRNVWDVMHDRELARAEKQLDSYLLAEGFIDGKLVATHKVTPARRPSKLVLWIDNEDMDLKADGSDLVTVVAAVADGNGNIKRLNNYYIKFEIEGEGELVSNEETYTNPRPVQWGTAPILVRSTTKAGKIKIRASVVFEGKHMPLSGEISFESVKADKPLIADENEIEQIGVRRTSGNQVINDEISTYKTEINRLRHELNQLKLKEVSKQQTDFE